MKKILTLVALAALAFTSCVKEDETYKRLKPVLPGMNIYNGTMTMQRIATQPADMAVRLAILETEAYKQDPEAVNPDLTKVKDGATNVFEKLFGKQATLTKTGNVYKLVFKTDEITQFYMSKGEMTVNTGGLRLAETSETNPWTVSLGSDYGIVVTNSSGYNTLEATAAMIKIYYQTGHYKIDIESFKANVKDAKIQSNWNTRMTFSPSKGTSLAYSDVKGESFNVNVTTAEGPACVTFDGKSATKLSLQISNGVSDMMLLMRSGTAISKLTGENDYNASFYKAREAQVDWSVTADNKLTIMINYNNIIENVTGHIR